MFMSLLLFSVVSAKIRFTFTYVINSKQKRGEFGKDLFVISAYGRAGSRLCE